MFIWSPYPFLRIALSFILGIIVSKYLSLSATELAFFLAVNIALFLFLCAFSKSNQKYGQIVLGNFGLFLIFTLGIYRSDFQKRAIPEDNWVRNISSSTEAYIGTISGVPGHKGKFMNYRVKIDAIVGTDSLGDKGAYVSLYVKKDTTITIENTPDLTVGSKVMVMGNPSIIQGPKNQSEFDYQAFMARSGVYFQHFAESKDVRKIPSSTGHNIFQFSTQLAAHLNLIIKRNIPSEEESAIATALLLGNKNGLNKSTRQSYATAGAMHVLAVSGLHVGTIYIILSFVLGPLRRKKAGQLLFAIFAIASLFLYALVTGLSPSVLRASTMFSLIILGEAFSRKSNIYNSLAVSVLILLTIDPSMLFSLGFQLSYVAVVGIVYLTPWLVKICPFKSLLAKKIWEISSVSIAAQISTFPITVHYFHQFPTYFLVSNVVVIPGAFIIMILGIVLFISSIFSLGHWVGFVLEKVIALLNFSIRSVERLDYSLVENLNIDSVQVVLLYLILALTLRVLQFRRFKYIFISTCMCVVYCVYGFGKIHQQHSSEALHFYHIKGHTLVDRIQGLRVSPIFGSPEVSPEHIYRSVTPFRVENHLTLDSPLKSKLGNIQSYPHTINGIELFIWNDLRIARVLQKPSFQTHDKIKSDMVVISHNAVESTEYLNDLFEYEKLIIDSSNTYHTSTTLMNEALAGNVDVYNIRENGGLFLPKAKSEN